MPDANQIKIFIAYSREDKDILAELRKNLVVLERTQDIDVWYDGEIEVGSDWEKSIKEELHAADIILLLISQNFIASDYCYDTEMTQALALHKTGKVKVIPIIARECLWQDTPFAKLQALPPEGKPIMSRSWENVNRPYFIIANELKEMVNRIRIDRKPAVKIPSPPKGGNKPRVDQFKTTKPISSGSSSASASGSINSNIFKIGIPILLLVFLGIWLGPKLFNNKNGISEKPKEEINESIAENKNEYQNLYDEFVEGGDSYLREGNFSSAKDQYEFAMGIAGKFNLDDSEAKKGIAFCKTEIKRIRDENSNAKNEMEFNKYLKAGDTDFNVKNYRSALTNYNQAKNYKDSDYLNRQIEACNKKIKAEGGTSGGIGTIDRRMLNPSLAAALKKSSKIDPKFNSVAATLYLKTLVDNRDNQKYKTIKLKDGRIWMAENLNYKMLVGTYCYDGKKANCDKYGRLYSTYALSGLCPEGWSLPSRAEWENLINKYGGKTNAYKAFTTDTSVGFNVTLSGFRQGNGNYSNMNPSVGYYTKDSNSSKPIYVSFNNKKVGISNSSSGAALNCRCIKN